MRGEDIRGMNHGLGSRRRVARITGTHHSYTVRQKSEFAKELK
jgi:hypothetical protein